MSNDDEIPNWFLWLIEHFGMTILAIAGLLILAFGGAVYIDHRLTDLETQLTSTPPRSFRPPDLKQYDPGEVQADTWTNRHLVYVPVYSHIYYQGGRPYPLETTLSIRNVDPKRPIYIDSVEYYDTSGKLAKTEVDRLIKMKPLETIEFLVEQRNSAGGSGANFLVRWMAPGEVHKPLIETVMVGTAGTQGISFGRTGIEVTPNKEN